jgi:potassium uptake TrkH family protein
MYLSTYCFGRHLITSLINQLNLPDIITYLILIIQIYFLIIITIEIGQASPFLAKLDIGPAMLLIFSFLFLILGGTGLLMLPEMTVNHHIPFINALFTSASASCVTGLIVVDTATFFSFKGQMVIMLLIQMGGINIISFATFFTTFYSRSTSVRYQSLMKDFLSTDTFSDTRSILREVIFYSLIFEFVGSLLIYFSWGNHVVFPSLKDKLFFTVFHAISAFNNAGFSLFTNNLYEQGIRYAYNLQIIIAFLIIFGGIGFITLRDILTNISLHKRRIHFFKRLQVNTRLVLLVTSILIITGAVMFYVLERNNALAGKDFTNSFVTSLFQSITTRTAGFNTVDFSRLSVPLIILFMFLMYIGASPGSTGGGIKTTTFAVVIKSALDTIRGKRHVEFYQHSISFESINKAYSLILFSGTLIFMFTFLLAITEPGIAFSRLLFEEISAFATVGLSTGITGSLSVAGKYILILSMFIGRVGTLTLILALSKKAFYTRYKYGKANIMIG